MSKPDFSNKVPVSQDSRSSKSSQGWAPVLFHSEGFVLFRSSKRMFCSSKRMFCSFLHPMKKKNGRNGKFLTKERKERNFPYKRMDRTERSFQKNGKTGSYFSKTSFLYFLERNIFFLSFLERNILFRFLCALKSMKSNLKIKFFAPHE